MTQDEIMEMWNSITKYAPSEVRITEFAHLVAAKEREACVNICYGWNNTTSTYIIEEIRARGEA
jgi:hypothetical protein